MSTQSQVKERPILFSGPMVRAILDGRKTQTRRIIKPQPEAGLRFVVERPAVGGSVAHFGYVDVGGVHHKELTVTCRHGQPGDRLWVRETWRYAVSGKVLYRADNSVGKLAPGVEHWRPSMFMRREASRLTLEVVSVRVERVQEISRSDAIAEGLHRSISNLGARNSSPTEIYNHDGNDRGGFTNPCEAFAVLWDSINGERTPWASNPFVWVVEFKRVTA